MVQKNRTSTKNRTNIWPVACAPHWSILVCLPNFLFPQPKNVLVLSLDGFFTTNFFALPASDSRKVFHLPELWCFSIEQKPHFGSAHNFGPVGGGSYSLCNTRREHSYAWSIISADSAPARLNETAFNFAPMLFIPKPKTPKSLEHNWISHQDEVE